MLRLHRNALDQMVALAYRCYPYEACGLIAGPAAESSTAPDPTAPDLTAPDLAEVFYPCRNAAASSRVYTIDPLDHLMAERDAEDHDLEINGVVHSHTHSEPYPSPTDIGQAPDPAWHYVIIGLKREVPEVRSYRIIDEVVTEESVEIVESDEPTG
jgi:proteasome lid subunit RPN8/RPN11